MMAKRIFARFTREKGGKQWIEKVTTNQSRRHSSSERRWHYTMSMEACKGLRALERKR